MRACLCFCTVGEASGDDVKDEERELDVLEKEVPSEEDGRRVV